MVGVVGDLLPQGRGGRQQAQAVRQPCRPLHGPHRLHGNWSKGSEECDEDIWSKQTKAQGSRIPKSRNSTMNTLKRQLSFIFSLLS